MLLTIQSGYTTAFLLWMLSTAFFFFNRDFKAKYLVAVIIIAVLIFLVLFELISQGFRSLAEIIDNKTISERLIDLAGGKRGLEQSEDPRLELYMKSINTFFAHPIFGSMGGGIGGHSFFLDNLGKYGLFGVVLFVPMYVVIYRKFYEPYRNTTGNGFIIWMFIQTLILSLVNTGMWLYVLCFFIPTILSSINKGEKKIEGSVGRKLNT